MNAADWQAAAEVLGVILVLGNILGGLFLYRMQAQFVTRAEHHSMTQRVDGVEGRVNAMDKVISGLFTNEDADLLKDKLTAVQTQNAQLLGELPGLKDGIKRLNHQIDLLIQNELAQSKGRP